MGGMKPPIGNLMESWKETAIANISWITFGSFVNLTLETL